MTYAGAGETVVLVHGSVVGAPLTWHRQLPLAEHFRLCIPDRPGFGNSPPLERGDFEREAPLMAALLDGGGHLVGHSYGAVIALHAAALARENVRSLIISEPGCLRVAAGNAAVDAAVAGGELLYAHAGELEPLDFLKAFRGGVGSTHETPARLEGELLHGARLAMRERPPWESEPPLAALREARFPKLVISGGHSEVFEAVCDVLARELGARRATIAGRGHTIPATGAPYNELLRAFITRAIDA
ncbi:MAG TPA: alpha/beta hydrolase [Solirubrobacteraceae bacterium]|nr:alpha/beta hydrolase [Solirubrobacteraceae bacterium]